MNSIVATDDVSLECRDSACDKFARAHLVPPGMEPAVHEIAFKYAELCKADGAREWRMWLTNPQDEYSEDEAAQLLRDINTAKALMHDLNAEAAK